MHYYRVYDHAVQVNTTLEIPAIPPQNPDYRIVVEEAPFPGHQITWVHNYDEDRDFPLHRLGKLDREYIVRFSGYADFLISDDCTLITCFPASHTCSNTIEHLLLDQILPRVLSRKMPLVLHTGAVVYDNSAIGFVGESGSGKSTLTTYLGRHGYPVLTDDCLVLEPVSDRFMALPSYPTVRLNPDIVKNLIQSPEDVPMVSEYSNKLRFTQGHGGYRSYDRPVTLRALFILTDHRGGGDPQTTSLDRCSMRDAFSSLVRHIFRLDPTDKKCTIKEFKNLNELVSHIPVYRLTYIQQYDLLDDTMRSILEVFKENHTY